MSRNLRTNSDASGSARKSPDRIQVQGTENRITSASVHGEWIQKLQATVASFSPGGGEGGQQPDENLSVVRVRAGTLPLLPAAEGCQWQNEGPFTELNSTQLLTCPMGILVPEQRERNSSRS
jgi:hypothetical protein